MENTYTYQPKKFFIITFVVTWISWFLSAYFSYQENGESIFVMFMIPGLIAPFAIALWMILASKNQALKKGFTRKLFDLRLIKPITIPVLLFFMPLTVVLSIFVSLPFGQSINQLAFSPEFSFTAGFIPVLLVLFLAASFEELGWRSYAMDSLHSRMNYFKASLIFGGLWALWHLPLFFIDGYYQNELIKENWVFALNFFVSVIPMAVIISWVCKKNGSSILAAILFHFVINISQELLNITQVTKCIETIVLIVLAGIIVIAEKKMFFDGPNTQPQIDNADSQGIAANV
ncbi:MAG: CPBP family intramembrane metalloprotease [Anaerolineaceae bacterium]|nr:CPBP family intramembrane metalloprotease [Anaerolineaceae bacterium]